MHNKYLDIAYHTIVSKLNDLDSVDEIRENKELRRQLIQLKLENQKLKNVEQNKDSLQELIKNLPKDKIEDIKERVKVMIDAYEWKSKDKITVYECNGTTIS
jgi:archaellum component FlaG (FlaF/FlaG flagellin family)